MTTNWDVKRLAGALGAEVRGADLADPSPPDIDAIKALLIEHHVLFFPAQHALQLHVVDHVGERAEHEEQSPDEEVELQRMLLPLGVDCCCRAVDRGVRHDRLTRDRRTRR